MSMFTHRIYLKNSVREDVVLERVRVANILTAFEKETAGVNASRLHWQNRAVRPEQGVMATLWSDINNTRLPMILSDAGRL